MIIAASLMIGVQANRGFYTGNPTLFNTPLFYLQASSTQNDKMSRDKIEHDSRQLLKKIRSDDIHYYHQHQHHHHHHHRPKRYMFKKDSGFNNDNH